MKTTLSAVLTGVGMVIAAITARPEGPSLLFCLGGTIALIGLVTAFITDIEAM